MLADEESTLAAGVAGSSTTWREVLCRNDGGVVTVVAAVGWACGDFDEVGIDTDLVGPESAGDAESGAAAATPCPAAIAAPRPAATAPARSHRTDRGVALRR
jgi:hypothetical protein